MAVLGIDLGGTKLALAIFHENGKLIFRDSVPLEKRTGTDVGILITDQAARFFHKAQTLGNEIKSIGISVPGISYVSTGRVWAPNIEGWSDYPLLEEVRSKCGTIPVTIDSDRACCILGETWQGNARGCRNAIYLTVGTGIGAGILINGEILRGNNDIAGCIGWMALNRPFHEKYISCGCFEYYASGDGIGRTARELITLEKEYKGLLSEIAFEEVSSFDVFKAYDKGDPLATSVILKCIEFWGMAVANLVSLFNPEKIIMGGGVFGPAIPLIPAIRKEAAKWAQPVGINLVTLASSSLAGDAGVYGAGFLALQNVIETPQKIINNV